MFGQTVKVNWNAKAQFSKYKTYSRKATDKPRNPPICRQPDVDVKKKVVVWPGQGTVEHVSKNDKTDADEVQ